MPARGLHLYHVRTALFRIDDVTVSLLQRLHRMLGGGRSTARLRIAVGGGLAMLVSSVAVLLWVLPPAVDGVIAGGCAASWTWWLEQGGSR